jgi:hypothetical protein
MTAFAEQRTYQQNAAQPPAPQNNFPQFQGFQTPPPPPVFHGQNPAHYQQPPPNFCCIKCGSRNAVSMQSFKKTYLSPVAYLGIFVGPLIFLLLALLLRVKHYINAPFCAECWGKFKNQPMISMLLNVACIFALFGGIIVSIMVESTALGFLSVIAGVAVGIFAKVYETKVSPKYKKVSNKVVVIDAPLVGEVTYHR